MRRIEKSWILEDEHYLATILHPKLKHFQMAAPGDKEKAIQLLKLALEKQISSRIIHSNSSHLVNQSPPANLSYSDYSKTSERGTLLTRCFDQTPSPAPSHVRECDDYLNSTTRIDDNENDDDDSELLLQLLF